MTLQLVAFNSDSCGYPARQFIGASAVDMGALSPAEQRWSRGQTVMEYEADYHELIASWMPPPSPTLELARLIASQPRITARQSPFMPVDTRRHETPSEHAKARQAGRRMLSLDLPASGADEPVTLADTVVASNDTAYASVDPTTEFRIESERRSALSSPLLRTHIERSPNGKPWVRTKGFPFVARMRLERLGDDLVYVFDDRRLTKTHYANLERRYRSWVRTWAGDAKTLADLQRLGRAMRFFRKTARRPLVDGFDPDPYRTRFHDLELDEPFEEPAIEVTDDQAIARFGRPLDLLYEEEVQELAEAEAEKLTDAGAVVPVIRHLRGHSTWGAASMARLHNEGAEYLASAADILG